MDRLAEQVVAWHNRHPLAKRITIYDVHTMGLVALPFMRSHQGEAPIEPVLTDEISPESLAAAWDGTAAAAAPVSVGPDDETRPAGHQQSAEPAAAARKLAWWQLLNPLLWLQARAATHARHWPVFSDRFIEQLSPRRVAAFALRHGYANPPVGPEWPQRVVSIDEDLLERGAPRGASGAWPYEIYLLSAGIDAGKSRSRVLVGIGPNRQPAFLGRRCWSPLRLGLLALVLAGLATVAATALLPLGGTTEHAASAASAASAVARPAPAVSAAASTVAAASEAGTAAAGPAPAPTRMASAVAETLAASAPGGEAAASAASSPASAAVPAPLAVPPAAVGASQAELGSIPNIRPQLSRAARPAPPTVASRPAATPAAGAPLPVPAPSRPDEAAKPERIEKPATPEPPAAKPGRRSTTPADALARPQPQPDEPRAGSAAPAVADGKGVALVGPASASKADAEALLARMLAQVQQTMGKSAPLQAQVFKTPEGWRPAIWPFVSREQAQLVNLTLVARGLHTRAIDF